MDINQKLNDIILKYQLDRYYPKYRKKLFGEKILVKWAGKVREKNVLCIGADQEDINYFSQLFYRCGKIFSYCLYSEIQGQSTNEYDHIVVISKRQKDEVIYWCGQVDKPVTFLYDYLELQGICCEDEIHKIIGSDYNDFLKNEFPAKNGWREALVMEFYTQKEKLKQNRKLNAEYGIYYARKLFFLSLVIRNFVQAEKYQKILKESGDKECIESWYEIQELLKEIREKLQNRKQKDIVMVWMDALSYGSGQDMPYLQTQLENGVSFEYAFTVTPYTNPTAQTLFYGKKLIDDKLYLEKKIEEEKSLVFKDLRKHGYSYKVISGYLSIFEKKLQSANYHGLYAPCSEILWDVLYNLMNQERPVFILAHALIEGHAPHLATRMEKDDLEDWSLRMHTAHVELDEQINYYMSFLWKGTIKIFMSDHGQPLVREQFHTYFVVTGEKFRQRKAKELFSYEDFPKLIHEILEGNVLEHPIFDREYVEVQMLDYYNPKLIGEIIRNRTPLSLSNFGYLGILTREYLYLKYHIGKEFLARWDHMVFEPHLLYQGNDICDTSLLPYFRRLIEGKVLDFNENAKFKYTRFLYKVYDNFMHRRKRVFELINQLLQKYPPYSIAFRMGGSHSMELFAILTTENKEKLAYIIDRNYNCGCQVLGLPIIPVEKMAEVDIKAVILSSFDHLEELRKEIPTYPEGIDILDIYELLENKGIHCDQNFYSVNYMMNEDYDVGFPIEELS